MKYQRQAIETHLESLSDASRLRAVVEGKKVQAYLEAFEAADERAVIAQARYKRYAHLALSATTLSALAGAVLLLPIEKIVPSFPRPAASLVQTISLIVSVASLQWLAWRKPLEEWLMSRARAEQLRGEIFGAVLSDDGSAEGGGLLRQKIECVLDAYIKDQMAFFKKSAYRHREAARRFGLMHIMGYTCLTVAVALGTMSLPLMMNSLNMDVMPWLSGVVGHLLPDGHHQWQLGFGTISSNLFAHVTARSMVDQDDRKAALYDATSAKLNAALEDGRGEAYTAADQGNKREVTRFFERLQSILEAEHVAWSLARPPKNPAKMKM